jgi:hypothetical protein
VGGGGGGVCVAIAVRITVGAEIGFGMHIIFLYLCGHGFSQYREPETKAQRTVVDAWKIPGMNPNVLQDSHNCETLPASSRSRSETSTVCASREGF